MIEGLFVTYGNNVGKNSSAQTHNDCQFFQIEIDTTILPISSQNINSTSNFINSTDSNIK